VTVAVIPSRAFSSEAVAVTPSRIFNSAAVEVTATVFKVREGISTVPVNVGDAVLALELTAVCMAENSVSISEPFTILEGLPDTRLSLAVKLVVLV
tara:strand:- start:602 stop:889 length:288 start_codon:yes stop_codon:yes gene_type:complete